MQLLRLLEIGMLGIPRRRSRPDSDVFSVRSGVNLKHPRCIREGFRCNIHLAFARGRDETLTGRPPPAEFQIARPFDRGRAASGRLRRPAAAPAACGRPPPASSPRRGGRRGWGGRRCRLGGGPREPGAPGAGCRRRRQLWRRRRAQGPASAGRAPGATGRGCRCAAAAAGRARAGPRGRAVPGGPCAKLARCPGFSSWWFRWAVGR